MLKSIWLTITGLLRGGINDLPATVTLRQVRSWHPHIVPDVIVPAGVPALAVWPTLNLLALSCEVLVYGQWTVGVVRWHVVGDRSARDSQRSAHYTKKRFINFTNIYIYRVYNFIFNVFVFSSYMSCTVRCLLWVAGLNILVRSFKICLDKSTWDLNSVTVGHWDFYTTHCAL